MNIKQWIESIQPVDIKNAWDRFLESAFFTSVSTALISGLLVGQQLLTQQGDLTVLQTQEFWSKIGYAIVISFVASILLAGNRVRRHVNYRNEEAEIASDTHEEEKVVD